MVKQVQKEAFQLSKQMEKVNLPTETSVAKRIICDMSAMWVAFPMLLLPVELLLAATGARQKYYLYLEETKQKAETEQSDRKRKAVNDHLELKEKKGRLQQDISTLDASADTLLT